MLSMWAHRFAREDQAEVAKHEEVVKREEEGQGRVEPRPVKI